MSNRIPMAEVREYDRVRITGKTPDCRVVLRLTAAEVEKMTDEEIRKRHEHVRVEGLVGTVGSATFLEGQPRRIKIWPDVEQPYNESGKIWFYEDDTESIELLERES